jgi:hypothetical protein
MDLVVEAEINKYQPRDVTEVDINKYQPGDAIAVRVLDS